MLLVRLLVRPPMCALYPPAEGLPGIADCELDAFLLRFFREAPFVLRAGLLLGGLVYQLTPLFTIFLPVPAFLLPFSLRERHVNGLTTHPLYLMRQSFFLLKTVAGMCWGSDPKVRALFALPPYPPDPGTVRTT